MEKGKTIKRLLLAGILLVLFLPLLQEKFGLKTDYPLKGAYVPAKEATFTKENWFNSSYQDSTEKWLTENTGFHSNLVKLHNQLEWSLYKNTNVKGVLAGNDDYLFEIDYLRAWTGAYFVGEASIRRDLINMKKLQDSLEKQGSTFLFVLAPSKCYYFPELLPERYAKEGAQTNYKTFTRIADSLHVNLINFNSWFVAKKNTSPYPLYPRTGVHWSRYGSTLAADSIVRWLEWKRRIDMPGLVIGKTEVSTEPRIPDDDMGLPMNLYFPIQSYPLGYPQYTFEDSAVRVRPRLLGIGDSYFWSLWDMGLRDNVFRTVDFWYYNKEVSHSNGSKPENADDLDRYSVTRTYDVVMMICTDPNLGQAGWGYLAQVNTPPNAAAIRASKIKQQQAAIRADAGWLELVRKKAITKGISLDSMIYLDAEYMVDQQ